ncbi:hypothetical protein JZ751_018887 [Albula glossodonta]|uniref:Uncharacterized protein n=1 Tax=Albula glossodonta TaxID=121402 RepID=A0A8T2MV75_9TELE|nr:hypothetical protein JZ751_018887 [Albula glossodonta]
MCLLLTSPLPPPPTLWWEVGVLLTNATEKLALSDEVRGGCGHAVKTENHGWKNSTTSECERRHRSEARHMWVEQDQFYKFVGGSFHRQTHAPPPTPYSNPARTSTRPLSR